MVGREGAGPRWRLAAVLVGALLTAACATVVDGTPVAAPGGQEQGGGDQDGGQGGEDPTAGIDGVLVIDYPHGSRHVVAPQRVDYDHLPPLGGAHDSYWAPCMGQVFTVAVRTEHFVHSMEHGAVWVTYNPDAVRGADLKDLVSKVEGQPYMVLSPFPGQESPVSLQSWGRQLRLDSADDPRFTRFVTATRGNPELSPEPGARCDSVGPEFFDEDDPPPFQAGPPGPNSVPVTGG
ncbi:DUF3105 domain-containing protein [Actinokineospora guangxiensis]|uniref:DUF3105 domain-containing protein n=1 Tax=Actinokineospora guangxiensis TaxID=1490288 RepID=A0ABW0EVQ0_9PSEU